MTTLNDYNVRERSLGKNVEEEELNSMSVLQVLKRVNHGFEQWIREDKLL